MSTQIQRGKINARSSISMGNVKDVIELFSHRDYGTTGTVSTFVVGNCDHKAKSQCKEHCACP